MLFYKKYLIAEQLLQMTDLIFEPLCPRSKYFSIQVKQ